MPTVRIRKPPPKPKLKVAIVTIYERVKRRIAQLDAMISIRKAQRSAQFGAIAEKKSRDVPLRDDNGKPSREGIHLATSGGQCWQPHVFLNGKRSCDYCFLYKWCLSPIKKLRTPGTQPADANKAYFQEIEKSERVHAKLISPPKKKRIKVTIKKKGRLIVKLKRKI